VSSNGQLSLDEQRAKARLEPIVGELTSTDVPGTSGACDFEITGPPDTGGVVEATEWIDAQRARQDGAIRGQQEARVPTEVAWTVHLFKTAVVKRVLRDPELARALTEAAAQHESQISRSNAEETTVDLLDRLRIERCSSYPAKPGGEGLVRVSWGSAVGWGWDGDLISDWIEEELLESELIKRKVDKLAASGRRPRHLYVGLDLRDPEGMGMHLAFESAAEATGSPLALRGVTLPEAVTSLWVWPNGPFPGLRVNADGSWILVSETAEVSELQWRAN
jgi:hypothetical protein